MDELTQPAVFEIKSPTHDQYENIHKVVLATFHTAVLTTRWQYPAELINIYAIKAAGPDHLTTTMI